MTSSKQFITTFGKSFPLFRLFLSVFFEPSPLPLGVEGEKKMVNRREEKRRRGGGVWGRRIRLLIIIIFFLSLVYFGVSRVKMTEEDWLKIQGQVGFGAESCASLRYFSSLMEKGEGDPFVAPFVPEFVLLVVVVVGGGGGGGYLVVLFDCCLLLNFVLL